MWLFIGFSAATLTMFAFIPQIIKIIKTKSAHDVSIVTLVQFALGVSLWALYGLHLRDAVIITANFVTLGSLAILLVLYRKYK